MGRSAPPDEAEHHTDLGIGLPGGEALPPLPGADRTAEPAGPDDPASRRRFVTAVSIGVVVVLVPYLWVLCDLWTRSPSLFRTAWANGYASNFYDLQTRAMLHGHLYVATGALGPEAFVHGGHQYTYFGIFPSLLRLPLLAVTSSLDGKLTAPSILLAWMVTACFVPLLIWRIRAAVRGSAVLGRAEAASYGVLVATVLGGTVLMALAANPWVFTEDIAWSVALTIGTLWALLAVMQQPRWSRVWVSGALILAAVLTRGSTGYACVIGAFAVALWFGVGRRTVAHRRWWLPMALAGLIPLGVSCAVDLAKLGILVGVAGSDQILYNRYGLKGSYFGLHFLPSTLTAYFRPTGLHFRSVFPFITLPSTQARPVGGIRLYGSDWVASVPAAMPLLFLLSLWGTFTAIRPGRTASAPLRIVLAIAAAGGAAVLVFGWVANRFVGDLVPFLVAAAAVGMVDVWRRLAGTARRRSVVALSAIAALGAFGIAANLGVAVSFQENWSPQQVRNLVEAQNAISRVTGHPLAGVAARGGTLPPNAPAGQLFIAGDCDGLYMANGISFGVPTSAKVAVSDRALLGLSWIPVERGPSIARTVVIQARGPLPAHGGPVRLAVVGGGGQLSTLSVVPTGPTTIQFTMRGPLGTTVSQPMRVDVGKSYPVGVVLDPYLHVFSVAWGQSSEFRGFLVNGGRVVFDRQAAGTGATPLTVSVGGRAGPLGPGSICRNLG